MIETTNAADYFTHTYIVYKPFAIFPKVLEVLKPETNPQLFSSASDAQNKTKNRSSDILPSTIKHYFLPERDYVTFGSLLSQIRLSAVCRL